MKSLLASLPVDEFIENVRHMPDIEAKMELILRRDNLSLQENMLITQRTATDSKTEWERIGAEIQVISRDRGIVNRALGEVNERMQRINWAKAVTALYGQEGFEACREWMARNYEDEYRRAMEAA